MEDLDIIALYWARAEDAIGETERKYGSYCRSIAWHILRDHRDSEECTSDTWWRAWQIMPPQRPNRLAVFLGKITRNLALDRWKEAHRQKRGGGQVPLALEELGECVAAADRTEVLVDDLVLTQALDRFLGGLRPETRRVFLGRYWYLRSIKELAGDFGWTESKVKMTLKRAREDLKRQLQEEGIAL